MVDYTEVDNNEVQASGIMQDEGKTSLTVKDARRKAESEKKSRSKEKRGSTEEKDDNKKVDDGKDTVKKGKKEDLKQGRDKSSVNKKRKSGAKEKDCGKKAKEAKEKKTKDLNMEEGQIGLATGCSGQEKKNQRKIPQFKYSQELKRKIAKKAMEMGNYAEVARLYSKELGFTVNRTTVRAITKQVGSWDEAEGNINSEAEQILEDTEGGEANAGVSLHQGKKEKEAEEDEEPEMMFDSRPKFEETPLSAGCMMIRMLEMKSKEIERKERLLEVEKEENARKLAAEKEKLRTTLEESINPKAGN